MLRRWKSQGGGGPWGVSPNPRPKGERLIVSDVTVEALTDRLFTSPAGLLLCRDELAGWLHSFDQYKGGQGKRCPGLAWRCIEPARCSLTGNLASP